jgi:hypothetical protein
MVAVLLPAVSVVPVWLVVAGVILAAGLAPIATWAGRALRSQLARRFLLAVFFACILARTTYAVICPSCGDCDPWWLEWFWICFPNP